MEGTVSPGGGQRPDPGDHQGVRRRRQRRRRAGPLDHERPGLVSEPIVAVRHHESGEVPGDRRASTGVTKLPVTHGDQAVGIVTTSDLARARMDDRIELASMPEPDVERGEVE